jgi:hypothetical protein
VGAPPEVEPLAADLGCDLVELRQYTLHPGQRDVLIDLFEREFIETQEAAGMSVMGQFRDLDADDRFVWLRGFADAATRATSLAAFYDGPVWQAHRDAANATMIDSDDVLLLQPWPGAGITMQGRRRAAGMVRMALPGCVGAALFPLRERASAELLPRGRELIAAALQAAGGRLLGCYVTHNAPNNFPRLPVREGEHRLVVFSLFDERAALDHFVSAACEGPSALDPWLSGPCRCLRLVPTARSALHR